MKLNKIFVALLVALTTMVTGCKEYEDTVVESPAAESGAGAFFPAKNKTVVEMEPTEATEITIYVDRTNSAGALDVPISVELNDNDVFVVPATVTFAAGETEKAFTVSFPTAAEGVTYNLKLAITGNPYVIPFSTKVTRIKWVPTTEPFIWVDGTFLTFYNLDQLPMYAEAEKATVGGATRYRFKNTYDVATPGIWNSGHTEYTPQPDADGIYNGFYYNYPGDVDETKDYYITIEIDANKNVSMMPSELGVVWSYGMISIGSVYGNLSTDISTYPLGKLKDGVITFPAKSLYITMANYNSGGKYPCGTPTVLYMTKAAFIAANLKITDFNEVQYDVIPGAVSEFESAAYSALWDRTIAKAVDIDPENEASEYKNLYYLADLYADGKGLAFYYDGTKVTIPADQPIGTQVFGQDIFVSQSSTIESKVETNIKGVVIYTFGLNFHYADGTSLGDFAETFYYSENPVSYDINDFYGTFKMTGQSMFAGVADANMNVTIAAGTTDNTFVITGVDYAASIDATFDPATSTMSIVPQTLADYVEGANTYDMTLYTYTTAGTSTTAALKFTFNMKGQLVLTSTSPAVAYLIRSTALGGWVDGYSNLVLMPQTLKAMAKSVSSKPIVAHDALKKIESTATKSLQGNFAIREKVSQKSLKSNIGDASVL